jgi:hypothetical protein
MSTVAIDRRDERLRDTIRAAVKTALDDGASGRTIINRLQSELDRLRETVPALSRRQLASVTARICARHGE